VVCGVAGSAFDHENLPYSVLVITFGAMGVGGGAGGCAAGGCLRGAGEFNANQRALIELAKEARRTGVDLEDARTLLQWAEKYGVQPALDHTVPPLHWRGRPHIRVGPINHIRVLK
jgi:hypothetical protein